MTDTDLIAHLTEMATSPSLSPARQDDLRRAAARLEELTQPATVQSEPVTPAMIDAYLSANTAYWERTDQIPTPPDKWRTGTPKEACAEGLRAAREIDRLRDKVAEAEQPAHTKHPIHPPRGPTMQLHIAHAVINISHMSALPFDLSGLDTDLPAGAEITTAAPEPAASTLTPPAYGEIWTGQGGIYVGTMPAMHGTPARHLIASVDQVESMKWALEYIDQPGARSHWNGPANCQALLDSKQEHPAAQWCHNYEEGGFTDWHLPSRADLLMAYMCAPERFEKSSYYWTSTQSARGIAFVQDFEYGYSCWFFKDVEFRVRAFRWILT